MFENWMIIHFAYLVTFVALAIRDVLFLRIVLSFANILQVIYQYGFNGQPDIAFWNGLFLMINTSPTDTKNTDIGIKNNPKNFTMLVIPITRNLYMLESSVSP